MVDESWWEELWKLKVAWEVAGQQATRQDASSLCVLPPTPAQAQPQEAVHT